MSDLHQMRQAVISARKRFSASRKLLRTRLRILLSRLAHKQQLEALHKKLTRGEPINVYFLLMDTALWKTDSIYRLLTEDSRFNPVILATPRINQTDVLKHVQEVYDYFKNKGYNVLHSYNFETRQWLHPIKDLDGDILFITNPHKLTHDNYYIKGLRNHLTCYVPYFEQICTDYETHFNNDTANFAWRVFQINQLHKKIAEQYSLSKGKNVVVTGYPANEPFYDSNYCRQKAWFGKNKTRIILAPHHSIEGTTALANAMFLRYAGTFLDLAKKYRDAVDFAFKPHPLLYQKLCEHPSWGKERTDAYWDFWKNEENTQLENGPYVDLFLESDAMIHDCSSFLIEYLYTQKPVLYLNSRIRNGLNQYGQMGYDAVPKAKTAEDIDKFIDDVVSGAGQSSSVVIDQLIPAELPSLAITRHLKEQICATP